ncbi:MAG: N-acetylmuramoyl-L-alanine amidase, partial [Bacteroidota bacterium]
MDITKIYLESNEFFHEEIPKTTIYLHHTAGSYRPDYVVNGWERDKTSSGAARRVGTAYVIGGMSTRSGNKDWDGKVVEAFPPEKWAHHLGIRASNNSLLNKRSVGIEICNYGPLTKGVDGEFYTYVHSKVPKNQVVDLGFEFRGYQYYHAYTDAQIEATKNLLYLLAGKFNIDLAKGMKTMLNADSYTKPANQTTEELQKWLNQHGFYGRNGKALVEDGEYGANTEFASMAYMDSKRNPVRAFLLDESALNGAPGVWTHTNVRKDKFDLSPQPKMI